MNLTQQQIKQLQSLRILHVEDDQSIHHQMNVIIGRYCPNLEWAANGEEALYKFSHAHKFDLIISDIRMPKLNGVELVTEIRKASVHQHIIITSSTEDTQHIISLINLGVNHFIAKPIDFKNLLKYILDFSQYQNYQKDMEAKNQELRAAVEQLELASGQLARSQRIASLAQLVTGIAHELNTPIGNCITMCTYVDDGIREIEQKFKEGNITKPEFKNFVSTGRESLSFLNHNLNKASALIRIFKQLSIEENIEDRHSISMESLFSDLKSSYLDRMMAADIHFDTLANVDRNILTYPETLKQVISNIIQNAVDHAFSHSDPPSGSPDAPHKDDIKENLDRKSITLLAVIEGHELKISISDNGQSMDQELQEKIFNPFFTTARNMGNIGLGLTVAYNLVQNKLRGQLNCASNQDTGTCFTLHLPLSVQDTE